MKVVRGVNQRNIHETVKSTSKIVSTAQDQRMVFLIIAVIPAFTQLISLVYMEPQKITGHVRF